MKKYLSWKGFPEYGTQSGFTYTGGNMQARRSNLPVEDNQVINFIIH